MRCQKVFSFYSIMIYLLFSLWMSSWTIVHYPVRGHPFVQKDSKINLSFLGPIHIVYWCFHEFVSLTMTFMFENVVFLYYISHFQTEISFSKMNIYFYASPFFCNQMIFANHCVVVEIQSFIIRVCRYLKFNI